MRAILVSVLLMGCGAAAPAPAAESPSQPTEVHREGDVEVEVTQRPDEPEEPAAAPEPTTPNAEPAAQSIDEVRERYLVELVTFLQDGWDPPPSPTGQERFVGVRLYIAEDGVLSRVELTQRSGDTPLDESVLVQVGRLVGAKASIPEPPEAIRHEWYGRERGLGFSAK